MSNFKDFIKKPVAKLIAGLIVVAGLTIYMLHLNSEDNEDIALQTTPDNAPAVSESTSADLDKKNNQEVATNNEDQEPEVINTVVNTNHSPNTVSTNYNEPSSQQNEVQEPQTPTQDSSPQTGDVPQVVQTDVITPESEESDSNILYPDNSPQSQSETPDTQEDDIKEQTYTQSMSSNNRPSSVSLKIKVNINQGSKVTFSSSLSPSNAQNYYQATQYSLAISDQATCDAETFDELYKRYRLNDPHIHMIGVHEFSVFSITSANSKYFGQNICYKAQLAQDIDELNTSNNLLEIFSNPIAIPAKNQVFPPEIIIEVDQNPTTTMEIEGVVERIVKISARHQNVQGEPTTQVVSFTDYRGQNRYYGNIDLTAGFTYITKEILNINCPHDYSNNSHIIIFKLSSLNDTACEIQFQFAKADETDSGKGVTYTYPTLVKTKRILGE